MECEYAVRGEIVNLAQVISFAFLSPMCLFFGELNAQYDIFQQKLQEDLKVTPDSHPFDEVTILTCLQLATQYCNTRSILEKVGLIKCLKK